MNSRQKHNSKAQLILDYGSCCCWCGHLFTKEQLTVEHLIPQSKGGPNARVNLMLACRECNESRDDSLFSPQNQNPTLFSIIFETIVIACQSNQGLDLKKLLILLSLLKELFRYIPLDTRIDSKGKLLKFA
jgi:hypothetical protein